MNNRLYIIVLAISGALFLLLFVFSFLEEDKQAKKANGLPPSDVASKELSKPIERWYKADDVKRGHVLYEKNCMECHGRDGRSTSDWRIKLPNGTYPPPPLNGSAHTWHHSMEVLLRTVDEGGKALGGTMPGFKDKLSLSDRRAVLAYIQSLWTDEIYRIWSVDVNKD